VGKARPEITALGKVGRERVERFPKGELTFPLLFVSSGFFFGRRYGIIMSGFVIVGENLRFADFPFCCVQIR
jgi:hypothetical protein